MECPKCRSDKVVKYDEVQIKGRLVKYYRCNGCGERFSKVV